MAITCPARLSFCRTETLSNAVCSLKQRSRVCSKSICINSSVRGAALFASKNSVSTAKLKVKRSSCPAYGSRQSYGMPVIQNQMVKFQSNRTVSLPFAEGTSPALEYLKEPERVVRVTFPDSARINYIGDSVWRSRLKPITFISVTATPICDIMVYNEDDALRIFSDKLHLDFTGVPDQFKNLYIDFQLKGSLRVNKQGSKVGRVKFDGTVSLVLGTDLPMPFSFLPEALLTGAGDSILNTILGAMESALVKGIIDDYHSWCRVKSEGEMVTAKRSK
ncbi:hypothetical protein AXG93_1976s1050 [Marchantia polymorpha subsp. ruderalis]|uniref:Uncharacterized protein n=1 Tax=Marchantia polymorpha subsp. ruderalis TaxID=1480154 RepID=A0A176VF10_MARPO|nr:hypothetical protein AXG93_1976s1050 [Marchantia polymorpha subsp. ruderalis]